MQESGGGAATIVLLIYLAVLIFCVAAMWRVYTKAGRPGWAVLIPFYNAYVFLQIAGKPGWWLILLLIPLVNVIFAIIALAALAQRFGKGGGFTVGLLFLPFIFYPILGFGDSKYAA